MKAHLNFEDPSWDGEPAEVIDWPIRTPTDGGDESEIGEPDPDDWIGCIRGLGMVHPVYKLTLQKTYYEKGFFNLGVDVERYLSHKDNPVTIFLGEGRVRIDGRMSRKPNQNNTPRVFGGSELRDWFMKNHSMMDVVNVVIEGSDTIWIN